MNLADLSEAKQKAIELDRARWFEARKMIENTRERVTQWLQSLPDDEREDMRRRLNAIQQRRKEIRGSNDQ